MEEMGFCVHKIGLKRSPKVKSAMALYLKIHFIRCTNYVCAKCHAFIKKCTIFGYAALLSQSMYVIQYPYHTEQVDVLPSKNQAMCKLNHC